MEQVKFVFEDWVTEAKDGLFQMETERTELIEEQGRIEGKLEGLNKAIAAMQVMLEAHGVAYEKSKPKPKRVSGIKKTLLVIAGKLHINEDWSIVQLIEEIRKELPDAPEKSIRAAVLDLEKNKIFKRNPDLTGQHYSSTIGFITKKPQETAQEPPEEPKVKETPKDAEPENIPAPDESGEIFKLSDSKTDEEVKDALLKMLKKKPNGIPVSDTKIAWMATEIKVENKQVYNALKVLITEGYEFTFEDNKKIIRKVAEPGSKEELQRMKVNYNPLFEGMDSPQ